MSDRNQALYIKVDDKFGVERSLRKFKRMCESFGVVKEYRKRKEYRKPSVVLLEKREAATKRRNKSTQKVGSGKKI
jgi:small subunit ribosomal protein S21